MFDLQELTFETEVGGSLQETLMLRGAIGHRNVVVLFSAEILDHWPLETQAARLNEMLPFIDAAARRAIEKRRFSVVRHFLPGDEGAYIVVLGWKDIAS